MTEEILQRKFANQLSLLQFEHEKKLQGFNLEITRSRPAPISRGASAAAGHPPSPPQTAPLHASSRPPARTPPLDSSPIAPRPHALHTSLDHHDRGRASAMQRSGPGVFVTADRDVNVMDAERAGERAMRRHGGGMGVEDDRDDGGEREGEGSVVSDQYIAQLEAHNQRLLDFLQQQGESVSSVEKKVDSVRSDLLNELSTLRTQNRQHFSKYTAPHEEAIAEVREGMKVLSSDIRKLAQDVEESRRHAGEGNDTSAQLEELRSHLQTLQHQVRQIETQQGHSCKDKPQTSDWLGALLRHGEGSEEGDTSGPSGRRVAELMTNIAKLRQEAEARIGTPKLAVIGDGDEPSQGLTEVLCHFLQLLESTVEITSDVCLQNQAIRAVLLHSTMQQGSRDDSRDAGPYGLALPSGGSVPLERIGKALRQLADAPGETREVAQLRERLQLLEGRVEKGGGDESRERLHDQIRHLREKIKGVEDAYRGELRELQDQIRHQRDYARDQRTITEGQKPVDLTWVREELAFLRRGVKDLLREPPHEPSQPEAEQENLQPVLSQLQAEVNDLRERWSEEIQALSKAGDSRVETRGPKDRPDEDSWTRTTTADTAINPRLTERDTMAATGAFHPLLRSQPSHASGAQDPKGSHSAAEVCRAISHPPYRRTSIPPADREEEQPGGRSRGGTASPAASSVTGPKRVEWRIDRLHEQLRRCAVGQAIWSPRFKAGGIDGLQFQFFPRGGIPSNKLGQALIGATLVSSLPDFTACNTRGAPVAALYLWTPPGHELRCQLFIGPQRCRIEVHASTDRAVSAPCLASLNTLLRDSPSDEDGFLVGMEEIESDSQLPSPAMRPAEATSSLPAFGRDDVRGGGERGESEGGSGAFPVRPTLTKLSDLARRRGSG
ncbi:unnamed protein product [Vitrella brassicaformis CCMP3155]|uniref:Uncharacterized protein n=3 Tax=Vitrella brassicaformis TaxID=1169539 RepID=A0A0G4EV92_VITBC|nr:unnamed protein product [Vitrella brassicaformis CCMP3155]|eukprot:CEM02263.1 unnamed protein product [Vitrella brassicaformis CCMP3155]